MQQVSVQWITSDFDPVRRWRIAAGEGETPSQMQAKLLSLLTMRTVHESMPGVFSEHVDDHTARLIPGDLVVVTPQRGLPARYVVVIGAEGFALEQLGVAA